MRTYTTLYTALNLTNKGEKKLIIKKVQKDGTKRTFFRIENLEGKNICTTLFARLYDAKRFALKCI